MFMLQKLSAVEIKDLELPVLKWTDFKIIILSKKNQN